MKRLTTLSLLICFLIFVAGQIVAQDQGGTPKMVIEKPVYDAGSVYRTKDKIEHAFIIKNTGSAELKILSAKPG